MGVYGATSKTENKDIKNAIKSKNKIYYSLGE